MKALRWIVVLAVLAYTAWLAWPFLQQFLPAGGGDGPTTMSARVEAPVGLEPSGQSLPVSVLWVVAIGMYLVSALMFAGRNARAFVAYVFAFGSNVALMLLQRPQFSAMSRSVEPAGIDPKYILLAGLALIGVLMLAIGGGRRSRHA
jgi:hypothetical protein